MTKKISYKIVGKYIKDLIFNIPNAKTFFLLSKNIENYKVNIDIRSKQIDKKNNWDSNLYEFNSCQRRFW